MVFDLSRLTNSELVAQIDYHDSLGSTSDRALEVGAEDAAQLPLLVLTEQQTAGRGRSTNRWLTTDGALTFSLVLHAPADRLPPSRWPHVALVAGVAVADALSQFVPATAVQLKWPNDIYLNQRKAGGILSESIPGWRDRLVVGIGINVNNRLDIAALTTTDIRKTATSLIEYDNIERDRTSVLLAILDEFDRRWSELFNSGFDPAAAAYRERCLLTGKTVTIQPRPDETITGLCRGIDPYGGLLIRTATGDQSIISGTVTSWEH